MNGYHSASLTVRERPATPPSDIHELYGAVSTYDSAVPADVVHALG
jgi:hypothetical protein